MASVAICTAVLKPKVTSVADRSLSIVLGTPTTATPCSACSWLATPRVSSPPMATRASTSRSARVASTRSGPPSILNGLVRDEPRIVPPRGRVPRSACDVEGHAVAVDDAAPPVEETDQLVAVMALALADHGPHDGVQAWAVAPTGQHRHLHGAHPREG